MIALTSAVGHMGNFPSRATFGIGCACTRHLDRLDILSMISSMYFHNSSWKKATADVFDFATSDDQNALTLASAMQVLQVPKF